MQRNIWPASLHGRKHKTSLWDHFKCHGRVKFIHLFTSDVPYFHCMLHIKEDLLIEKLHTKAFTILFLALPDRESFQKTVSDCFLYHTPSKLPDSFDISLAKIQVPGSHVSYWLSVFSAFLYFLLQIFAVCIAGICLTAYPDPHLQSDCHGCLNCQMACSCLWLQAQCVD
jgi:hypothetical protein